MTNSYEAEKIPCICAMRELFQALAQLESNLQAVHGLTLNEAMVLCSIGHGTATAGTVAQRSGLKPSHVSKVIAAVEGRGLVERNLDRKDKRLMCFTLTDAGCTCLARLREVGVEAPPLLRTFFEPKA